MSTMLCYREAKEALSSEELRRRRAEYIRAIRAISKKATGRRRADALATLEGLLAGDPIPYIMVTASVPLRAMYLDGIERGMISFSGRCAR